MKVQLNTNLIPLFTGTYESPYWEVREYDDGGEEVGVDYDFKEFMASIVREYQGHEEYILSELGVSFIKSIKFTGTFYSPAYYNFSTDTLDFELSINKTSMLQALATLESDPEFSKYLHDNYTSYDGFMSFTPNNYQDLAHEIKTGGQEFDQSLGALITYLAIQSGNIDADGGCSIEAMIAEDWQGNGYNGLEYTVEEPEVEESRAIAAPGQQELV